MLYMDKRERQVMSNISIKLYLVLAHVKLAILYNFLLSHVATYTQDQYTTIRVLYHSIILSLFSFKEVGYSNLYEACAKTFWVIEWY